MISPPDVKGSLSEVANLIDMGPVIRSSQRNVNYKQVSSRKTHFRIAIFIVHKVVSSQPLLTLTLVRFRVKV